MLYFKKLYTFRLQVLIALHLTASYQLGDLIKKDNPVLCIFR